MQQLLRIIGLPSPQWAMSALTMILAASSMVLIFVGFERRVIRIGLPVAIIAVWAPSLAYLAIWRASLNNGLFIPAESKDYIVIGGSIVCTLIAFGCIYSEFGLYNTRQSVVERRLIECIYFSVITWTTVGYGDFVPLGRTSRAFAAYQAILGYVTMIAIFAAIFAMADPKH